MKTNNAVPPKGEKKQSKADRFWGAFLFTENGKPKSSLIIYTFCLSFVFLAVYVICFLLLIGLLTEPLGALPAFVSNAIVSLLASAVGVLICSIPHRFVQDKRLVFGAHLWLLLYAVASLIAMLIMLNGEATNVLLVFFGWFVAIPLAVSLPVTAYLYRRDHHPKTVEPEPEWKKYVNRR